ncbi:hypothetical protein COCCADRAFT_32726 [Bipolaris zeicola 26-R-13]|uniref:C2H2-type domain-containing protein n=1 Tax=Cochliobolus carbonum (strain 26-R-13) TaxID=930089 RepID=W6YL98_COCC2|nr:uncharacterized protein COCCADRAFT_32726 [Bipolaris zeicola 26-R-13]EUC38273.1 hypothetical protein COCCADRAFT_32726 [Bipolaris zeicola 26-R-13]
MAVALLTDHRIEQDLDLFFVSEAFQFSPDEPLYDSVSLVDGQILDYSERNNACSQSDLLEWTNYLSNAICGGDKSVGVDVPIPPPLGTLDESVHQGTSGVGYSNTSSCIDPSLLTQHVHEPCCSSLSWLDQSTKQTLAENSQSQLSPHQTRHSKATNARAPATPNDMSIEAYPSPSSLPSLGRLTPKVASPPDTTQIGLNIPDGKIAIEPAGMSFICKTCTKSFPNKLRYDRHANMHSCKAPSRCEQCGQSIKHLKDLKRHLGSNNALPSCPALKNDSPRASSFMCFCSSKTYTRKDSLVRHLRTSKAGNHRCRTCNKNPCACS